LNTFAQDTAGVLEAVRAVRALTTARGDDPPIWITELGWVAGGPPSAFRVSEPPGPAGG
jgi:exo-beta-1,3-glucanase (GH17 family)